MSNARELAELGGSYGTGGFVGMKNRIINGAMVIDQRNAGASVSIATSSGTQQFAVDRFYTYKDTSGATVTAQRSSTAPAGFTNSHLVTISTGSNAAAGEQNFVQHNVEGFNIADLAWGTASAQPVTLSFWVRGSVTGTYGIGISNNAATRCYIASYTINSANTWEYKTITIAGDQSGTWLTDNSIGIRFRIDFGSGSNYQQTPSTWSSSFGNTVVGRANAIGTSGATFYLTGFQLEKGSTATSFDYRPYGTELALCQRYYERFTGISSGPYRTGYGYNTSIYMSLPFQVTKRTTGGSFSSSASGTTLLSAYGNGSSSGFLGGLMTGSINFNTPELTTMTMYQNLTASTYSPYGTAILWTLNNNQWVDYSAEL